MAHTFCFVPWCLLVYVSVREWEPLEPELQLATAMWVLEVESQS